MYGESQDRDFTKTFLSKEDTNLYNYYLSKL